MHLSKGFLVRPFVVRNTLDVWLSRSCAAIHMYMKLMKFYVLVFNIGKLKCSPEELLHSSSLLNPLNNVPLSTQLPQVVKG